MPPPQPTTQPQPSNTQWHSSEQQSTSKNKSCLSKCKATLKVLDLHKGHLQMMLGCVSNLINSCNELLFANDKQQPSGQQFVKRASSHMTQTQSFLIQSSQLTTITISHLLPNYCIHVTTKHLQQESSTIFDILDKFFGAIVLIDLGTLEEDIKKQMSWKVGGCVGLDECSVQLCWTGVQLTRNHELTKRLKFRYVIRHVGSGDNIDSDHLTVVVYEGFDEQCVVTGLQPDHGHEFELLCCVKMMLTV
eukprot:c11481_g1_i1.p1 GENE.c11481_g1_i1~~c11481_g1_i1.p1  ORF type:complete len:248 (+),score=77.61 c11481_g1_i1:756-1499(+)